MKNIIKTKPKEKSWVSAKLFHVYFNQMRLPICGLRFAWAVVGHKWVRVQLPFCSTKFKLRRSIWDQMDVIAKGAT